MTIVKILIVFFMLGMIFFRLYLMKRRKGKKNKPYSFLAKQKEEQEKNDIFNLINKKKCDSKRFKKIFAVFQRPQAHR